GSHGVGPALRLSPLPSPGARSRRGGRGGGPLASDGIRGGVDRLGGGSGGGGVVPGVGALRSAGGRAGSGVAWLVASGGFARGAGAGELPGAGSDPRRGFPGEVGGRAWRSAAGGAVRGAVK